MTKEGLLDILAACAENGDIEVAHIDADRALILYIADPEIAAAFDRVSKWYA